MRKAIGPRIKLDLLTSSVCSQLRRAAESAAAKCTVTRSEARQAADAAAAAARGVGGAFWVPRVTEQQVQKPFRVLSLVGKIRRLFSMLA